MGRFGQYSRLTQADCQLGPGFTLLVGGSVRHGQPPSTPIKGSTMRMLTRAIFAASLAIATGAAFAATPATGLGQSWPNVRDVSTNPNFHVYVFALGGVNYIQVNDYNGNVLGSIGTAGGQFITLPIGRFAQQVATPDQPASAPTTATPVASSTMVYNDGTTAVTATPLSDGTMRLNAAASSGICPDPVTCSMKGIQ